MNDLRRSGIDCSETYGTTSTEGELAAFVVVRAGLSTGDSSELPTIAEKALSIAKRYGETALKAAMLEVRIVSHADTSQVLLDQTF